MAHNEPELLHKLLVCLDDERNDIYIHLDVSFREIDEETLKNITKFSKVFLIERKSIIWSSYTQIDCELRLLRAAAPRGYGYYHLISGVDLPIKTQDYIHDFFEKHRGQQFVSITPVKTWKIESRYKYYHFERINKRLPRKWSRVLRFPFAMLQALLFINRHRNVNIENYFWGDAWFSITHDFADFILSKEDEISKIYNHGFFSDEVFMQTYLMNTHFKEKASPLGSVRLIDWTRGNPYTWSSMEFNEIMASNAIFTRKFSMEKDADIINKIIEKVGP